MLYVTFFLCKVQKMSLYKNQFRSYPCPAAFSPASQRCKPQDREEKPCNARKYVLFFSYRLFFLCNRGHFIDSRLGRLLPQT